MNDARKRIGSRMKARREYLGLTQGQIANRMGVQTSTVSNYESGNRPMSAEDIDVLCRVLKVKASYFYEDDDQIEEDEFVHLYKGAQPILKKAARDMLRAASRDDDDEETTHGRKAG